MLTDTQQENSFNQKKVFFLVFGLMSFILGSTLLFLLIFQIINWTWINGFVIGLITAAGGLALIYQSWGLLLKTENPYLYVLLLIIRLGLYLIPFLLAFFILDETVFAYQGILIGYLPLIFFPWVTSSAKLFWKNS